LIFTNRRLYRSDRVPCIRLGQLEVAAVADLLARSRGLLTLRDLPTPPEAVAEVEP